MIPGKKYTPDDLLLIGWRHKWLIVLPTLLAAVGTVMYTRTLPDRYRSETMIRIEPPRVRADLVRTSTSTKENPADRVQSMTQQILSRTRLEAMITDFKLYANLQRTQPMENVIERMRDDVEVEVVRGDAFRIAYESDVPVTTMRVTERLARHFIEENLKDRELLAEGTSEFLNSQLEDARRRLVEQEKRLEEYRRRHSGELPSQLQANLSAISGLQTQAQSVAESLAQDRDRLQLVERELADLTSPQALAAEPVVDSAGGTVSGGTTQQQLVAAREALSRMTLRLKPEHPDVARMTRVVRDLETKVEAEALEAPVSPEAQRPRTSAELARVRKVRQLEEERELIRKAVAEKEQEQKKIQQLAGTYQQRIDAAPTRETELIELSRDYETLQKLYTNLLSKSEESKIAVNLESRQIGWQFRIIDPARVPAKPFSPDRLRLNLAGTALGLVLGLGMVVLLEWRDTSLKTDDDVTVSLGLPVLALVPFMRTTLDQRRTRRRRWAVGVASVVVLATVAAAAYWVLRT